MAKKKENTIGMAAMLHFADLGYTTVIFNFSGSGDSGDIDDPVFFKKGEEESGIEFSEGAKRRDKIDSTILTEFKEQVGEILNGIEDWWNNDGGQGEIEIQIPSGEYKIEVSINHTETTEYNHNGTLTDQ
jgi:hypothetical protein